MSVVSAIVPSSEVILISLNLIAANMSINQIAKLSSR